MPTFWRVFIIIGCWILLFFCIYWDDHMFYSSVFFFNMVCHIDWFTDAEKNLCIHRMNHTSSRYMIFQCIIGFRLLVFCWGFLHPYSSGILSCNFLSLRYLGLVSVSGWWRPHRMRLVFPRSVIFWNSFRRIGVYSSLNVW